MAKLRFNAEEILVSTRGRLVAGSRRAEAIGLSIDSRTIRKGELFIAIKGNRYDGHTFLKDALEKGASGIVISDNRNLRADIRGVAVKSGCFVIEVAETLKALGDIAHFHRKKFDIPMVAITGSNGKTTTKEMIEGVLSRQWSPLKNIGTENNLIGVPLTLLRLNDKHDSVILELGMNRFGEIKRLTEICCPNVGIITNIGPSHLEFLGDLREVFRAKKEMLDLLGSGDIAVLNNDNSYLSTYRKRGPKIVTFGIKRKSDFRALDIVKKNRGWEFKVDRQIYRIPIVAYHDVYNALAAISVGSLFNIKTCDMKDALSNYAGIEKRMNRSLFRGIEIIDDSYNSNPLSLENAIKTLESYKAKGSKFLVSGDMLELGKKSIYYHDRIGRLVARSGIGNFIGIGEHMRRSLKAANECGMNNAWFCKSKEEAASLLERLSRPGDVILVKGSRRMQMEDVIRCFTTSSIR